MESATTQVHMGTAEAEPGVGRYNLFAGELEGVSGSAEPDRVPEAGWLFGSGFGLALPEDRAGKEIIVEEKVALSFPGKNRLRQDRCIGYPGIGGHKWLTAE